MIPLGDRACRNLLGSRHACRVALVCAAIAFLSVAEQADAPAQQRPPSRAELAQQVERLRSELVVERTAREQLSDHSSYFFEAVAIVIGVASALLALIAIVVGVASYKFFQRYVREVSDARVDAMLEEKVMPTVVARLGDAVAEFDDRLEREFHVLRRALGQPPRPSASPDEDDGVQ